MHALSFSVPCGVFPDQGSNPCLLHWQVDFLYHWATGKAPVLFLIDLQLIYNVVLVSSVQKSDSVINIYIYMCIYMIVCSKIIDY